MKKTLVLLIILALLLGAGCSKKEETPKEEKKEEVSKVETKEKEIKEEKPKEEKQVETPKKDTKKEEAPKANSNKIELGKPIVIGKYEITFQKYELIKDSDGTPYLKITYDWKNNGDKDEMATLVFNINGFQDGVETDFAFVISDDLDLGIGQKKVRPGYGQEGVQTVLSLNPEKPIEIELSETFSFSNDKWSVELKPEDFK